MIEGSTANLSTIALLRADLIRQHNVAHGSGSMPPSGVRLWLGVASSRFYPVLLCRIAHGLYRCRLLPLAKLVSMINFLCFGVEIALRCPIGPGLQLPHTSGTVIGSWSIGANATIFQGVTIGAREIDFAYSKYSRPTLGDGVTIGAGAKVLGGIFLGENVRVGANAVVLSNIPPNSLAVGIPAQVVREKNEG